MRRKYNNKKVEYNGITFDSILERDRYIFLKDKEVKGEIMNLKLQTKYDLQKGFESNSILTKTGKPSKIRPITYKDDFSYLIAKTMQYVIEDTKGYKTEVYKLKKKMLLNLIRLEHHITFREVTKATQGIG